ncbi:MAG: F0F1 ATP synthase subunit A [Anaerolineae bacterium]|nr:F0F1 ATP synthase subunit A [Anaerolineae bacterium]
MERIIPRVVFTILGIPVRNSVISTWIVMAIIVAGVLILRKKAPIVLEMLVTFTEDLAAGFIKRPTARYVPFLGTLLVFIAVANLIGVVPLMFTPTRDINTPLALALVVFFAVFVFAVKAKGGIGFIKGFLTPLVPLDLIGYFSRTMSLTLRLFGNVIGGEIVVAVLFSLIPIGIPLVMVVLSSITGILQAYVFTVLAASYIATIVDN